MGIGPVPATRKLMERLGLKISDFDLIELNEAFALAGHRLPAPARRQGGCRFRQSAWRRHRAGSPPRHERARGWAMTAVHGMEKRGGSRALATMCVGVGQGVAMAIEKLN